MEQVDRRPPGFLARALRVALDRALPPLCPGCRTPLADPAALCATCWRGVSFICEPLCPRLGVPFPFDPGPGVLSMQALAEPPAYDRARAAVRYEDVARALVHACKYRDRPELARMLGAWMARAGRDLLADADGLVPVPLHWGRLWGRRFNQAAELAKAIARESGVPLCEGALRRVRATRHQVGLSRSERAANMQGAFRVGAEAVPLVVGRRLVLVDDVLTTGSTLEACARALSRAGAARVDVLVFARVVDPVRPPI
jgi:ComF family protein